MVLSRHQSAELKRKFKHKYHVKKEYKLQTTIKKTKHNHANGEIKVKYPILIIIKN